MSCDIAGYVKLTVKEIRQWTDKITVFNDRYEECMKKLRVEDKEREGKKSWFERVLFVNEWTEISEWTELHEKHVPPYLRGLILGDWHKRLEGLSDDHVILIDLDDAKRLRQIAGKLEQPEKETK